MVEIYSESESCEISEAFLAWLEEGWNRAFAQLKKLGVGEISDLETLEISLLDDGEMARLHGEFLGDANATDVITFEHGELLIGVEVAGRQAEEFGSEVDREIALYGIHGMLHLSGYDDIDVDDANQMALRQKELLDQCFPLKN